MPLTEEQQSVCDDIRSGNNVVCISKPGTGKTTTAIECARHFTRTLLLTYNRKLKEESRSRVAQLGLSDSVEVHSYHAAACKLFVPNHKGAVDDSLIFSAISSPPQSALVYDFVVVDEAQDMTPLYAQFVVHVLSNMKTRPQMLLIGDPFQRIFKYLGATWEYMMDPLPHFGNLVVDSPFVERHLTVCWRITPEMAAWVNENLNPSSLQHAHPEWWSQHGESLTRWWAGGIVSGKAPSPGSVKVVPYNSKQLHTSLVQCLPKFDAGDCAFLCKTVRRPNDLLSDVVETFAGSDWVVTNDTSGWEPDERSYAGKTIVTTINRFKGLERKFVCVVGLDGKWENMQKDPLELFTLFLVATTRASEQMVIVTGEPAYATIRKSPLPPTKSHRKYTPEAGTLLQHTCFHPVLNVAWTDDQPEGAVKATLMERGSRGIDAERVDASRFVPGRREELEEDASPFMDAAIILASASKIGLSLSTRAQRLSRSRVPPSLRKWLSDARDTWTREETFMLSVAHRAAESQYYHQWRQVKAHPPLMEVLDACTDNVYELLTKISDMCGSPRLSFCDAWTVGVEWEWFCESFDGGIEVRESRPHFAGRGVVVTVLTAPTLRHDTILLSAFVGALRSIYEGSAVRSFVIHANDAALYEVTSRLDAWDLVGEIAKRKVEM